MCKSQFPANFFFATFLHDVTDVKPDINFEIFKNSNVSANIKIFAMDFESKGFSL